MQTLAQELRDGIVQELACPERADGALDDVDVELDTARARGRGRGLPCSLRSFCAAHKIRRRSPRGSSLLTASILPLWASAIERQIESLPFPCHGPWW